MRKQLWLWLILIGYVLITFAYSVVNPLFEAPDEHWHYFTAQYIKDNGRLPFVAEEYDEWLSQEAAQPPLYYLLGAALITPVDTENSRDQVWLNPFFYAGDAAVLANVNQVIHTPAEAWPWQGVALAAHGLRLFSLLLGMGTLLCLYGCGRLLWPHDARYALLATAVAAFLPQFNFIHASVTNDSLITFLCAFALWQLLWLWFNQISWPRLLLLGISCGLAALTKNAGILLLAYAIGVLLLRHLKELGTAKVGRWLGQTAVFVIIPAVTLAGWLWLRNYQLYGDVTATEPFIRLADGDREFTLLEVFGETGGLVRSLFAVFGWFNLLAPTWVYAIWSGIVLLALLGVMKTAVRCLKTDNRLHITDYRTVLTQNWFPALLLFTWFLLVYAGLVAFMLKTPAAQGRLLFPALVPLVMALVYGLTRWRWRGLYAIVPLAALLTTLYCCFFVIRPAYAQPLPLAALPDGAESVDMAIGDGLSLKGVRLETNTAVPGDIVWLDLYWQAETGFAEPPERVVELFGRDLALLENAHSYHAQGKYPANLWPLAEIVPERVGLQITETVEVPVLARVFLRLSDDGEEGMQIATVKIVPSEWPEAADTAVAQIGEHVQVTAVSVSQTNVQPGEDIEVNITWRVLQPPGLDLTTFVHLANPGQPPLATGDNQPIQGQYPTRVWEAGEIIQDHYTITIPVDMADGRFPLWLGMYDSETITRWPLFVNGERQPNDALQIGEIEIVSDR